MGKVKMMMKKMMSSMGVTMMMTKRKRKTRLQERSNGQNELSAGILHFLLWGITGSDEQRWIFVRPALKAKSLLNVNKVTNIQK
jgi:hypothetical protein